MSLKSFLIFIILILFNINVIDSVYECLPVPCILLSEFECNNSDECIWDINYNKCVCNSLVEMDIVIGMDSSGSMLQDGWDKSIQFVVDIITTAISPVSNVAITQWSQNQRMIWNMNQNQNRTNIVDKLYGAGWLRGFTYMKDAVLHSLDIFNSFSTNFNKLFVLMTDGNPVPAFLQSPCNEVQKLRAAGMNNIHVHAYIILHIYYIF